MKPTECCDGLCLGGDDEFADICVKLELRPRMIARPGRSAKGGNNDLLGDPCRHDEVLPQKPFLERNKDIVEWAEIVVACPFESELKTTGGTWFTVSFTMKKNKGLFVVWPDGKVTEGP